MNVRNLIFIIVLFAVWIMGYYHYMPKHPATLQTHEQSSTYLIDQPLNWADGSNTITQEKHDDETVIQEEPIIAPVLENKTDLLPLKQPEKQTKKKKDKKRKSKKEIAKISIQPSSIESVQPAAQQTISQAGAKQEMISIQSSVVKKDIGYYKMLSWHYPHLFNLTVNDQPLFTKRGKTITQAEAIKIPANELFVIRYSYEWHTPWGKRIGAKKVTFKPDKKAQQLSVAFKSNWKQEQRIVVDGATKISDELLEEETAP